MLALTGGCTIVLYDGPRRTPDQVSWLGIDSDTRLVSVDTRSAQGEGFDVFEVLPGVHRVVAVQRKAEPTAAGVPQPNKVSSCFQAEPGKSYVASISTSSSRVGLSVVEKASGRNAGTVCPYTGTEEVAASSGMPAGRQPAQTSSRAHENVDEDAESAEYRPGVRQPLGGFRLGLGLAFGGDDLIEATMSNGETRTLSAGGGVDLTLGGTLTPLWIANAVGFGVGASVGVKYDSVGGSNGKVDLTRFPIELWAQTLLRLSPSWFFVFAGGAHKDSEVTLGSSGVASGFNASFDCPWGWMVNAGFQSMSSRYVGYGFGFHYVNLQYWYGREPIDAQAFGIDVQVLVTP